VLKGLNCWNTLIAFLTTTESEKINVKKFENKKDWAISSQTPFRWRFRDYNSQSLKRIIV